jgi:hypothetical protein
MCVMHNDPTGGTHVWLCPTLPELNSSSNNPDEVSGFVQMVSEPCVGWLTISWKALQQHRVLLNLSATYDRFVRSEILTKVLQRIQIFWDVILCHQVSGPWHFERFWCICLLVSSSQKRIASWTVWPWRWRHYSHFKQWEPPTQQHSIISQSIWILSLLTDLLKQNKYHDTIKMHFLADYLLPIQEAVCWLYSTALCQTVIGNAISTVLLSPS